MCTATAFCDFELRVTVPPYKGMERYLSIPLSSRLLARRNAAANVENGWRLAEPSRLPVPQLYPAHKSHHHRSRPDHYSRVRKTECAAAEEKSRNHICCLLVLRPRKPQQTSDPFSRARLPPLQTRAPWYEPGFVTLCRDQAPAPWNIADHLYVWMPAASSAGGAWKPTGSGCESLMSNSQARASSRVCACSRP